jgi:hypothetical protein
MSAEKHHRFTLRQLPLPAKLVLSTFLISVGLGYFSAMVQLHMQHSERDGNALPTPDNVIERFSGLKRDDGSPPPKSKLEEIISAPREGGFDKNNMTRAFYDKSNDYKKDTDKRGAAVVDPERETERLAMIAWIKSPDATRKATYSDGEDGKFPIPVELVGKPITADYLDEDTKSLKINKLILDRCVRCHGGDQKPDLDTYEHLRPMLPDDKPELIAGKWLKSGKQMTIEGLTQSTHAHLLSFSVLFTCTGLIFAFTSLPASLRMLIGPMVLIAQVADISCWWLARLPAPNGPIFAQTIMATGAIVGLGVSVHIIYSLFDMYGSRGRLMLLLLFMAGGGVLGTVYTKVLEPALAEQKAEKEKKLKAEKEPKPAPEKKAEVPPPEEAKKPEEKPKDEEKKIPLAEDK